MVVLGPIRQVQRRFGFSAKDSRAVIAACLRHRPFLSVPLAAGSGAFFGSYLLLSHLLAYLVAALGDLPDATATVGVPIEVLLGLVASIFAGALIFTVVRRELVLLELAEIAAAQQCLRCRYPLHGLPATDARVHCPECGLSNPAPEPPREPA